MPTITSSPSFSFVEPYKRRPFRNVPFDEPRPTTVGAAVEGLQHVYDAPGRVEFELEDAPGETLSLTAFNGHVPGGLTVLFTDATTLRTDLERLGIKA